MLRTSRIVFGLILGSFFISGLAGLLYQVVWTRYLALFLGHTGYAVVVVLVAFMGGLAAGNAWLGARVDRVTRPLRFYAILELLIGLYALVFPRYYEMVHATYLAVVRVIGWTGPGLLPVTFLFAGLAILPPTVLMGATLPALTRYVTRSLAELRGKVAALYAINSTGAVLGVILADWWWIPAWGLEAVVLAGAAMSLTIGAGTLLASHLTESDEPGPVEKPVAGERVEVFSRQELRLALVGIGLSGFVAMLYEVAWTRLLALAIGSSTHAYSLMLLTFISGIAVGGWLVYRWRVQRHTLTAFAWAELALAGTLLVSMCFYDQLPFWFAKLSGCVARVPSAYPVYEVLQGFACFVVMFLPAVCLGTTLPLVSRVATSEVARSGSSVGRVFAVNTLGTVLGAALTGLVLLPVFGLARTFALGIALNALVACLILGRNYRQRWRVWLEPVLALALAWTVGLLVEPRWQRSFSMGLWRVADPAMTLADFREQVRSVDLRYHADGPGATVDVVARRIGDELSYSLKVNGKTDASSKVDMSTQLLLGHIPMLLRPSTTNALVVGAGSGATVGALLQHPGMAGVDVVEISQEVITASKRHFAPFNNGSLTNARTRLFIEDAKTYLKGGDSQYGVILAEPSNPWMAGVAGVFSREFYEDCRTRLAPGGLMVQWLQVYETTDETFNMVVGTLSSVFPHLGVWVTSSGDRVLVGSVEPFSVDLEAAAARFADPGVAASLQRIGMDRWVTLLGMELIPMGDARHLPGPGTPVHSDFYPRLEYTAQEGFFLRGQAIAHVQASELGSARPRTLLGKWLPTHPLTAEDCAALVRFVRRHEIYDLVLLRSVAYRWLELDPSARAPLLLLAELAGTDTATDGEYARVLKLHGFEGDGALQNPVLLRQLSVMTVRQHRALTSAFYVPPPGDADAVYRAAIAKDPENQRSHRFRYAELLWNWGRDAEFMGMTQAALDANPAFGSTNITAVRGLARRAFAQLLDLQLRKGDLPAAFHWAQIAVDQGYVNEEEASQNLRLSLLARKIYAEVLQAQEKSGPRNSTPATASPADMRSGKP